MAKNHMNADLHYLLSARELCIGSSAVVFTTIIQSGLEVSV